MRKFSLIAACVLFITNSIFGQDPQSAQMGTLLELNAELESLNQFKKEMEFRNQLEMKKSKLNYYLTDWDGGVTYTNDDQVLTGKLYRYNIYTDQIEVREVLNPVNAKVVVIGSRKFIHSNFTDEGLSYNGYFEMIVAGDCKLLVKRKLMFQQGNKSVQGYGSDDTFRIKPIYYIKKGDAPAIKVNRDKNILLEALADKDSIDKYIRKKSFPFLTEKGLRSIVKKYNEL